MPAAVTSAATFTPEALCATLTRALQLIAPEEEAHAELPAALPGNVAARHRAATALARCIKAAGFAPGEVGYNQLLYPSEKDVRRLLSWAVGRLPRSAEAGSGGEGKAATPASALLRGLRAWMQPPAVAPAAVAAAAGGAGPAAPGSAALAALEGLQQRCGCSGGGGREGLARARALRETALAALRLAAQECGEVEGGGSGSGGGGSGAAGAAGAAAAGSSAGAAALPAPPGAALWLALAEPSSLASLPAFAAPSWEELLACAGKARARHFPGTRLDAAPSAFNRRAAFAIRVERRAGGPPAAALAAPSAAAAEGRPRTEEEVARDREEELAALAARLERAKGEAEALAAQGASLGALLPSLRAALEGAGEALAALERGYSARRTALDQLPQASEHCARLEGEAASERAALERLAGEWEAYRAPLAGAIAAEEAAGAAAAARLEALLGELARQRSDMAAMRGAAAGKEEAAAALEGELARVAAGGGETRAGYQRLVMGTVAGIRKQKAEIARIVGDVRALQLELAAVGEGLKRIAGVALEAMERAAQEHLKEGAYREAFAQLLRVQDTYGELVATVAAEGAAVNETRDLENRIDQLMARNESAALEAVERDLAAVRAENAQLLGGGGGRG